MKPDNLSLTLHAAELLYELGEYEEALPRLHKVDYHHPESLKSLRLLAECHFMSEKRAQAAKYYERMIAEHAAETTSTDWQHAAYNYWLMEQRNECFRCLSRAEELYQQEQDEENTHTAPSFADKVYGDSRLLTSLGAHKEEMDYLYDAYYRSKNALY